MSNDLKQKYADAIWIAKALFDRNKATGSSANLSFKHDGRIYITGTGTCFGRLGEEDFAILDGDGNSLGGAKPSKEYPLHLSCYRHDPEANAVIHTHSFYATAWSSLEGIDPNDAVPKYTPYLDMKLGTIRTVPYATPGTKELFELFASRLGDSKGYLLCNHGPVVFGSSLLDAFYGIEELEESCRMAFFLNDKKGKIIE